MNITEAHYRRAVLELTRLNRARKDLGKEINAINRSADYTASQKTRMIAAARAQIAALDARKLEIVPIVDRYLAAARARNDARRAAPDAPPELRCSLGDAIGLLKRCIEEYNDRNWSEDEARIINWVHDALRDDGIVAQLERAQASAPAQAAELAALRQQVAALQARESAARRVLRALWDARYDEVDTFRIAHGVRYRVHIDEETAAQIQEAL